MKLYDGGATIIIIIALAALVGYASSLIIGDDNIVEETAEMVIEKHTGYSVDLTPNSREK